MPSMACGTFLKLVSLLIRSSMRFFSDDLIKYLRPFAEEGKVVNESDVREFFASLTAGAKKTR